MYETNSHSRALIIAATQHRIAGDFLLAGSEGNDKLPVRAVICEQYTKAMRLALESFVTHVGVELETGHLKMTLFDLFVYCEKHGLELRDSTDFSKENFELLLVACGEKSNYKYIPRNASYTSDLVWPQLYAAHLIDEVQSKIECDVNRISIKRHKILSAAPHGW
jgi:hypothetical protein